MSEPTQTSDPNQSCDEGQTSDESLPLMAHLLELRRRLLRGLVVLGVLFIALLPLANQLYQALAAPLLAVLPAGHQMIATQVESPFTIPMKLALFTALLLSLPFWLYQVWGFVAPALYRHERRRLFPLLVLSCLLFALGMAFAYFAVLPVMFVFLTQTAPQGVQVATDISHYLDFVLGMLFAFGMAFEVPVAVWLLCWSGITSPAQLTRMRPYVIVAAFVVGMLLTPPDVLSQVMLAVPLCLLFELGLLTGRLYLRPARRQAQEAAHQLEVV